MNWNFKKYSEEDYLRIRDFIVKSYDLIEGVNSWLIDRWEFVPYFAELFLDTFEQWQKNIGIWQDENDEILGVVCTDNYAFMLLDTYEPDKALLSEMFHYCEERLFKNYDGINKVQIAIPDKLSSAEIMAKERGFIPTEVSETITSLVLDKEFEVMIPEGFTLKWGAQVEDTDKAMGHIMAFDYPDTEFAHRSMLHYGNLKNAPDYRADLDLYIVNGNNEVVSFCTIWYDAVNQIGILEPVGTHINYILRGLGKAVIYEGLNRIKRLGATKVYVGAAKPIYLRIGFAPETILKIWEKQL